MGGIQKRDVSQAKQKLLKEFRNKPGFIGAGVGVDPDGMPVVLVFIEKEEAQADLRLPSDVDGVRVRVETTGKAVKR